MPDSLSVVSTCIDKAVHCGETKGRLYFLLVFIFKIRKHCYNCADYSCYTGNNCNDSVESHTQSLPFFKFWQSQLSLGDAALKIRHFQYNNYTKFYLYCIYIKNNFVFYLIIFIIYLSFSKNIPIFYKNSLKLVK